MSKKEIFTEEGIPARSTEEHTVMNDCLIITHEASDNKQMNMNR